MSWLDSVVGAVSVQSSGSLVGQRATLNFSGSSVSDDPSGGRVTITSDVQVVHAGPLQIAPLALTIAQASAPLIVVTGSFDGSGVEVQFPPAPFSRATDDATAVCNFTNTDFEITQGAWGHTVPPFSVAVVTWSGTSATGFVVKTIP